MSLVLRTLRRVPRAPVVARSKSTAAPSSHGSAKFGKSVASDESAAQSMNDIGRGRYEYIGDFVKSMNKGPVKLEFGERAPSAKDLEKIEAQEKALQMMKRSMMYGAFAAFAFVYGGWLLSKRALGVTDAKGFSEAMNKKMPKVSGEMEDSVLGRQLKAKSAQSRDAISEDPELTAWRRSLRDKFNTPQGKELARKNSILMSEKRQQERIERQMTGDGTMAVNTSRGKKVIEPEVVAIVAEAQELEAQKEEAPVVVEAPIARSDSRVVPASEVNKIKRRASVSWSGGATGSSTSWAARGPN